MHAMHFHGSSDAHGDPLAPARLNASYGQIRETHGSARLMGKSESRDCGTTSPSKRLKLIPRKEAESKDRRGKTPIVAMPPPCASSSSNDIFPPHLPHDTFPMSRKLSRSASIRKGDGSYDKKTRSAGVLKSADKKSWWDGAPAAKPDKSGKGKHTKVRSKRKSADVISIHSEGGSDAESTMVVVTQSSAHKEHPSLERARKRRKRAKLAKEERKALKHEQEEDDSVEEDAGERPHRRREVDDAVRSGTKESKKRRDATEVAQKRQDARLHAVASRRGADTTKDKARTHVSVTQRTVRTRMSIGGCTTEKKKITQDGKSLRVAVAKAVKIAKTAKRQRRTEEKDRAKRSTVPAKREETTLRDGSDEDDEEDGKVRRARREKKRKRRTHHVNDEEEEDFHVDESKQEGYEANDDEIEEACEEDEDEDCGRRHTRKEKGKRCSPCKDEDVKQSTRKMRKKGAYRGDEDDRKQRAQHGARDDVCHWQDEDDYVRQSKRKTRHETSDWEDADECVPHNKRKMRPEANNPKEDGGVRRSKRKTRHETSDREEDDGARHSKRKTREETSDRDEDDGARHSKRKTREETSDCEDEDGGARHSKRKTREETSGRENEHHGAKHSAQKARKEKHVDSSRAAKDRKKDRSTESKDDRATAESEKRQRMAEKEKPQGQRVCEATIGAKDRTAAGTKETRGESATAKPTAADAKEHSTQESEKMKSMKASMRKSHHEVDMLNLKDPDRNANTSVDTLADRPESQLESRDVKPRLVCAQRGRQHAGTLKQKRDTKNISRESDKSKHTTDADGARHKLDKVKMSTGSHQESSCKPSTGESGKEKREAQLSRITTDAQDDRRESGQKFSLTESTKKTCAAESRRTTADAKDDRGEPAQKPSLGESTKEKGATESKRATADAKDNPQESARKPSLGESTKEKRAAELRRTRTDAKDNRRESNHKPSLAESTKEKCAAKLRCAVADAKDNRQETARNPSPAECTKEKRAAEPRRTADANDDRQERGLKPSPAESTQEERLAVAKCTADADDDRRERVRKPSPAESTQEERSAVAKCAADANDDRPEGVRKPSPADSTKEKRAAEARRTADARDNRRKTARKLSPAESTKEKRAAEARRTADARDDRRETTRKPSSPESIIENRAPESKLITDAKDDRQESASSKPSTAESRKEKRTSESNLTTDAKHDCGGPASESKLTADAKHDCGEPVSESKLTTDAKDGQRESGPRPSAPESANEKSAPESRTTMAGTKDDPRESGPKPSTVESVNQKDLPKQTETSAAAKDDLSEKAPTPHSAEAGKERRVREIRKVIPAYKSTPKPSESVETQKDDDAISTRQTTIETQHKQHELKGKTDHELSVEQAQRLAADRSSPRSPNVKPSSSLDTVSVSGENVKPRFTPTPKQDAAGRTLSPSQKLSASTNTATASSKRLVDSSALLKSAVDVLSKASKKPLPVDVDMPSVESGKRQKVDNDTGVVAGAATTDNAQTEAECKKDSDGNRCSLGNGERAEMGDKTDLQVKNSDGARNDENSHVSSSSELAADWDISSDGKGEAAGGGDDDGDGSGTIKVSLEETTDEEGEKKRSRASSDSDTDESHDSDGSYGSDDSRSSGSYSTGSSSYSGDPPLPTCSKAAPPTPNASRNYQRFNVTVDPANYAVPKSGSLAATPQRVQSLLMLQVDASLRFPTTLPDLVKHFSKLAKPEYLGGSISGERKMQQMADAQLSSLQRRNIYHRIPPVAHNGAIGDSRVQDSLEDHPLLKFMCENIAKSAFEDLMTAFTHHSSSKPKPVVASSVNFATKHAPIGRTRSALSHMPSAAIRPSIAIMPRSVNTASQSRFRVMHSLKPRLQPRSRIASSASYSHGNAIRAPVGRRPAYAASRIPTSSIANNSHGAASSSARAFRESSGVIRSLARPTRIPITRKAPPVDRPRISPLVGHLRLRGSALNAAPRATTLQPPRQSLRPIPRTPASVFPAKQAVPRASALATSRYPNPIKPSRIVAAVNSPPQVQSAPASTPATDK